MFPEVLAITLVGCTPVATEVTMQNAVKFNLSLASTNVLGRGSLVSNL
jgi:hypothetical protein